MKKIRFLSILLFFSTLLISAQKNNLYSDYTSNITFQNFTSDNGLSNNKVNCIFQDSRGFIWIGTASGLNRFDGFYFKTYLPDPDDSTTITDNRVNSVIEDSAGNIWIMTENNLHQYDRRSDNFYRKIFKVNNSIKDNLPISCGFIDSRGYIWLACANDAIYRFKVYNNPQIKNKYIDVERFTLEEHGIKDYYVIHSFVEDKDGIIWTATLDNEIFYFDVKSNGFKSFSINLTDSDNFTGRVKKMMMDSEGDFLITIELKGIVVWKRKTNEFTLYKPNGTNAGPNDNLLFDMAEDLNGRIWIGEREDGGINIFDKKEETFSYLVSDEADPYSLGSSKINCLYRDKTGSMWVGTIKGINVYIPGKKKFRSYFHNPKNPYSLNFNNILCFEEDKSGYIWIGTDGGGLNRYDRKTGKFIHFLHNPDDKSSIISNAVISLCEDRDGTLWIGTFNGGLVRMKDNSFYTYRHNPNDPYSISSQHVWSVFEDSKGNFWVAHLNQGIDLFDRKTGRFYSYRSDSANSNGLVNNSIIRMFEDSRQQLYVTTYSGVSILDLNAYDFSQSKPDIKFRSIVHNNKTNGLSSIVANCVAEDADGNIWFGMMSTGLDKYNPETGEFKNYSTHNGLPGNSVNSILIQDDVLWLGTDKGLASLNPKTGEIHVFGYDDGLLNLTIYGGAIKTRDGEMFFGGPNGFNSFYPENISFNRNIPPVVITGLRIYNKPVKINEKINGRIVLTNAISESKEIVLTYKENFFTLEFIALDYASPEKNQYSYKMEGFDNEWINCGTKREANYTNLNPGKYTFYVKASNNDDIWNKKGTSLQLVIQPPWWKTILFRISFVLFIVLCAIMFYSYRVASLKRHKTILKKLVRERTLELEIKNRKLQEQTDYLNETNAIIEERQQFIEEQSEELRVQAEELSEKNQNLKRLNATKDKFFSIIAHDLRNPFNSVIGFTELLYSKFYKLEDEKKIQYAQVINTSVRKIYKLLENLLQWARSQTGTIQYTPEEFYIDEIINENILLVKDSLEEKAIGVRVDIVPNAKTFADRNMINTVVRNLLSNAIKFTDNGEIKVTLKLENGYWKLNIEDSGTGITSEKINKIFEIDQSKSTEGTRGETGTGLGLIICKEFVDKNKGKISVESELGKGSVFTVDLPAV